MSDILYSKLRLEVPQVLDGQNATIRSERGTTRTVVMDSPVTDIMLAGMEKYNVKAGLTNENVSFGYGQIKKIEALYPPSNLDDASWSFIQQLIANGTFGTYYAIGNTKTFQINNKTYTAEVVSINNGTGSAGSWYPNKTVDFICKELYETAQQYNSTDTNSGGFPGSALKNTLDTMIYPLLQSDLKDVIINKSHSYASNTSGTTTIASTKLWIPTNYEVYGSNSYAAGETSSNNKRYTLSSLIKTRNGQTSAGNWWLGTVYSLSSSFFFYVNSSGSVTWTGSASTAYGVPICFRIG